MEITVHELDHNSPAAGDRLVVGVVDVFESLIWTDRYNEAGDFELHTYVDQGVIDLLQKDRYISIPYSDKWMVIESVGITTHAEEGARLVFKGRSLESLLDRRIVLQQEHFDDLDWETGMFYVISNNVINSPGQPQRNFQYFSFVYSLNPTIQAMTLTGQYLDDNVYDIVVSTAKERNVGWRVRTFDITSNIYFQFEMYLGTDRSYNQSDNPFVVFSPEYDNLVESDYFTSKEVHKTYCLVVGDNTDGPPHRVEVYGNGGGQYINRREMSLDRTNLSKFYEGTSTELPVSEYTGQLEQEGRVELQIMREFELFTGVADTTQGFVYREDYDLGDIVQVEDAYGNSASAMITEMTLTEDESGIKAFPTFEPF